MACAIYMVSMLTNGPGGAASGPVTALGALLLSETPGLGFIRGAGALIRRRSKISHARILLFPLLNGNVRKLV
jgi:hypothetical protein